MLRAPQFIVGFILTFLGVFIIMPFLTAGIVRLLIVILGFYLLLSGLRLIRESSTPTKRHRHRDFYDINDDQE